jgi:hypothetical protein
MDRSQKMNNALRIDMAQYLHIGPYMKIDLKDIMYNFYEIGPEIAWPRFVENLLSVENEIVKINKLNEHIITPEVLLNIRNIFFKIFEANKKSIEQNGYIKK